MIPVKLIPTAEFQRIWEEGLDKNIKLALLADMCRANTLAAVKRAGSGHLGSSLSAMDIVVRLFYEEMNINSVGIEDPNRDIYFSSKGHDVPGLYSVLFSLGILDKNKLMRLRRFGGLDGHPDIRIPGIEANSGSLGMGISKGKGMAWAKNHLGLGGRLFVMTGDGELQEGQNYEALQSAAHQGVNNLTLIVDHNKIQSDKPVAEIVDLGDLERKFSAFGWYVTRYDGNSQDELEKAFVKLYQVDDRPKVLIADTIKGKGVSFMEHPQALKDGDGCYPWHAGAPSDEKFFQGHDEIVNRVNTRLRELDLVQLHCEEVGPEASLGSSYTLDGEPVSLSAPVIKPKSEVTDEYVAEAYGKALVDIAENHPELVVLDADLSADCRTREFEMTYPDRFIESGIAEQDMVSTAGGLANQGLLPVVNSFASFLASRANEQIYNNATEGSKIIYVCHYAGLIPAGPGKSHQSIRDISLFGALPNCIIMQPCNSEETRQILNYVVTTTKENCMIRLVIGPSPRKIKLPAPYSLTYGQGVELSAGGDALLFAYGPVMLHESLLASEILNKQGIGLKVVNMPWINRVDRNWLLDVVGDYKNISVLEDHAPVGGLADFLLNELVLGGILEGRKFTKFAVEGYPECGTPPEVLKYHSMDGNSLALRIREFISESI